MELFREARGEVCLRVSAILALVLSACLVGFDSQTKTVLFSEKKATYNDLDAFRILVYTTSAAAGYNLLQICKHFVSALPGGNSKGYFLYIAWVSFLLDQMAVYIIFGANTASIEASMIAVTGVKALQWIKVCDKFKRFCVQIGGAFLCGYLACILMALISSISAFKLFSFYSPKRFLRLKPASY